MRGVTPKAVVRRRWDPVRTYFHTVEVDGTEVGHVASRGRVYVASRPYRLDCLDMQDEPTEEQIRSILEQVPGCADLEIEWVK